METFSVLLALCAENSPVSGEFPAQRPVTRSFGVFFDLRLNKRLSKHWWGWWFGTQSCSLWRHCNIVSWSRMVTKNSQIYFIGTGPVIKLPYSHASVRDPYYNHNKTKQRKWCAHFKGYIYIYIYQMDCVCQRYHKECSTRTCADDCYNCWKKSKLKSYVCVYT